MPTVIDFHTHVFADPFKKLSASLAPSKLATFFGPETIGFVRKQGRHWMKPISGTLHSAQVTLRHLPDSIRRPLDEVMGLAPLPGLLIESTPADLLEGMDEANINYAVVIPMPGLVSNEFVLETCRENPRLIPVAYVPKGTEKPGQALKNYVKAGAKALKIHPAADGEGAHSPRYRALLRTAESLGLPVILHTGCIHSHLLYKDPSQGRAEAFSDWFKTYSGLRFILAHMNFHDPYQAIDLCEEFPNLWVDTSWQPAEIIGEAARRIGPERILFATDWPLVGNNLSVGRQRIQDCVETGLLNPEQAQLILGENALKLLGLSEHAH